MRSALRVVPELSFMRLQSCRPTTEILHQPLAHFTGQRVSFGGAGLSNSDGKIKATPPFGRFAVVDQWFRALPPEAQ
jgi:hypothetical protein